MENIQMKSPQNKVKDETPTWIKNVKHDTVICIPRYQLLDHKKKLDANGDHIFIETEPEFVPAKKINPFDDEKKDAANKRANSDKTMNEIQLIINGTKSEIEEFAKLNSVSLSGIKTKKEMLEKLEQAGVLY